eukprot:430948_1
MAEDTERIKQYTYGANSNLVIQRERPSHREMGPSGEVDTLSDISIQKLQAEFGSRVSREKPKELEERMEKFHKKKRKVDATTEDGRAPKRRAIASTGVLGADVDTGYRPRTADTRTAYDVLLAFTARECAVGGDQHDVVRSCAELVLSSLKNEKLSPHQTKADIEEIFGLSKRGGIADEKFHKLVNIGKKITDFHADENEPEMEEDDVNVPIVFPDDESDSGVDEVVPDEEDEESNADMSGVDEDAELVVGAGLEGPERKARERERHAQQKLTLEARVGEFGDDSVQLDDQKAELDVKDIGAYWLQKQLARYFKEATDAQRKSAAVLKTLAECRDERLCENELVELLGFDAFDFIKLLMRHRLQIVYCTRLARATEKERAALEETMTKDPRLHAILEQLHSTSGSMADRTKQMQRQLLAQAHALKVGGTSKAKGGREGGGGTLVDGSEEAQFIKKKMLVDLDGLSFKNEGHTMTNKEWSLPSGTKRQKHKGYVEVYVPYKKGKPVQAGEEMPIAKMPKWTHDSFQPIDGVARTLITKLNRVQSKTYKCAFETPENMLLCAPTGAGKTVVAQLCMLREIGLNRNKDGSINLDGFKIVYVAPMKSLVREMVNNFSKRFKAYGVNVKELSGDQQLSQQQIQETQIIVTTPEKWDIITRKSGDRTYTQLVKLIIIDEIHLLHDSRGPVLESLVARTIRQVESSQEVVRLVGLSATLPNSQDVAHFLRVDDKDLFVFDSGYRPCPLTQCFVGLNAAKPYKQLQLMNRICYDKVVDQRQRGNQVLIFVHSRKETANTARFLKEQAEEADELELLIEEGGTKQALLDEVPHLKYEALKSILPYGVAIHHAGMPAGDRRSVEDLFSDGYISVLVSTATLAWGVNLPAHCVIIKGTQVYSPEKSRWTELSMLDVMQMTGRAGRPGRDTYGEAFVLTTQKELKFYMSLLNEQLPVESQLISKLADHLNAEIVLGTVRTVREAIQWLYYTYLYVRMLDAPELYGVPIGELSSDRDLVQRRVDLIHSAATVLDKTNLVKYDRKGATFQTTDLGRVASHFYLTHDTIATFNEYMKPSMSDIEILRVFSLAGEFKNITVREEEKLELAKLLDKVPIPVKESIEEPSAKVNVLLQAYISRLKLEGFALQADMQYVTQSAARLMRALFTIAMKRGWAVVATKCLDLCKMTDRRMWGIESPLRQFSRAIPNDVIRRIERKEFPWERFFDLKSHEIGELIHFPKLGKKVHKYVHSIPVVQLSGHVQPITRTLLRVELTLTADFQYDPDWHYSSEPFWIFVEDVDGETLLHHEYFLLISSMGQKDHVVQFSIPIYDPLPPQYFIRVVSDRWLGSESVLPISFSALILPEKYPPPTELLDLQPQPVNCFDDPRYTRLYSGLFDHFNPIQTQAFQALYKSDDSVLLCAPTGSGKTICAEFAILRLLESLPNGKCVFIAPLEPIVVERYMDWQRRFGAQLGVRVVQLTGDTATDLKLIQNGQIIMATAERWDMMSRRWKTRKNVQNINLVIVDELHLIGGEPGPTLEIVTSRMRYIASQTERPIRIVGLSSSVANAQDLGEWIGASGSSVFNFSPNVRPVRLDIFIQGFDINHYESRQLAMVKPAYMAITHRSPHKPVLVFVPSRKMARRVAIDFMNMAAAEDKPHRFIPVKESELAPYLKPIRTDILKTTLKCGIGFYHQRMTTAEKSSVSKLFRAGAVQVLVAEAATCWGMDLAAHMVVILGTEAYDGAAQRYVDYPITDLLQMIGRASRPKQDQTAKAVVYCHTPRKDFYKKFLYEPFPVESHLDHYLYDHVNAEIVTKTVENVQEAVDYLTWTFLYRRFHKNPNYYNLSGVSHRHLSDHLSQLVEDTLEALEMAKCITMAENDDSGVAEISPLNLGMIAAYYYVQFSTIELFSSLLKPRSVLKSLLSALCAASEFEQIAVRKHEAPELEKLGKHLPLKIDKPDWNEPRTKCHTLFQAHFQRLPLAADVAADRNEALKLAPRMLLAMVDVMSSNGWLSPALAAMELSQMITQGMWDRDSQLLQLPHITKDAAKRCKDKGIDSIFTLVDEDEADILKLLDITERQFQDVARVCNQYPNIDVTFDVVDEARVTAGKPVSVQAQIVRDEEEEEDDSNEPYVVPKVFCPRFPAEKTESWWLVIGQPSSNALLTIKRIAMKKRIHDVKLEFIAPKAGKHKYLVYLMSDSYLGCDQEYELSLDVQEGGDSSSEESGSDMSDSE